jgi:Cdc6-like AAA superfamily ATPase
MAQADSRRIERAARNVASATRELRQAIKLAREAGETYEDIGRAA